MIETLSLFKVAKTLKKPLDDLYDLGTSKFKNKLERWKVNKNINCLYKKIASIQKVNTIWQIDKEVNLKKFYYPSKLIINDNAKTISNIKKIPDGSNIVIQGTVGQGKSVFLRYLCSQELRIGTKIPIFFELRKIQEGNTLKHHLTEVLDSWGFEIDDDLFDFFANSEKFVFLLDGFDEIAPSLVQKIINELELLSEKYPNLRIIITSRPDGGIEKSTYFKVYKLAPLTNQDHEGVLKKLLDNNDQCINILKALNKSSTQINNLLTTPLMMTLLVLVYKAEQKIPEQFSEFYENLFQTLLMRHDNSKPGYTRAKNSPINERKLQELFEAFCFLASKESLTTISNEKIHNLTDLAIKNTNIHCDATDFIKDISKIVCLVIEEGFDFHFIHKSVREYHAANFIKRRADDFTIKFYDAMLINKWTIWKQELNFLSQVDEYRFSKYFLKPYIEDIFKKFHGNIENTYKDIKSISTIKEINYTSVMISKDSFGLMSFHTSHSEETYLDTICSSDFNVLFSSIHANWKLISKHKIEIIKKAKLKIESENKLYEIQAKDLINIAGIVPQILEALNTRYKFLHSYYFDTCIFIENEEKKENMLDF